MLGEVLVRPHLVEELMASLRVGLGVSRRRERRSAGRGNRQVGIEGHEPAGGRDLGARMACGGGGRRKPDGYQQAGSEGYY